MPTLDEMLMYVMTALKQSGDALEGRAAFRSRSEHTRRVCVWAKRLIEQGECPDEINQRALLIAAIFHDIGYAIGDSRIEHAENSYAFFMRYADAHGFSADEAAFIGYLIRNHSHKELMRAESSPIELILLMEADLLDETGATSILWDSMVVGANEQPDYLDAYNHVLRYTGRMLTQNPMQTAAARAFWQQKQQLVKAFLEQLQYDLAPDETQFLTDRP